MALSNFKDIQKRFAEGKGFYSPFLGAQTPGGVGFSDNQYEGRMSPRINMEYLSTYPSTLTELNRPGGTVARWLTHVAGGFNKTSCGYLGFFYKIGTLVLSATGDQFTHDAATFPVLRSFYGEASQPVPLVPVLQVTTATTVTAARFRLQTAAGSTGYKNQENSNVTGTYTMGFSTAARASGYCMILPLESNDSAVTDIVQIRIDTAASAGAATIWGFEAIAPIGSFDAKTWGWRDLVFGGVGIHSMNPAAATSGSATSYFGALSLWTDNDVITSGVIAGVKD